MGHDVVLHSAWHQLAICDVVQPIAVIRNNKKFFLMTDLG